jgi:hypothetical protein
LKEDGGWSKKRKGETHDNNNSNKCEQLEKESETEKVQKPDGVRKNNAENKWQMFSKKTHGLVFERKGRNHTGSA